MDGKSLRVLCPSPGGHHRSRWRKHEQFTLTLAVSFQTKVQCTSQHGAPGQHLSTCFIYETESIFNLIILLGVKMRLFPKKLNQTKFREKPTTAHTPEDGGYLCYCAPRLTCGCPAVLCLRDPEITMREHTEEYMSLAGRALEKMYVHNPKHVCTDIGPGTCSALDSPHINPWTLWPQGSECENWVECGASCFGFGPIICGWVNWRRTMCKRAALK